MSEYDAATYEKFSGAVRRQVQSLRIILDNLQVIPHVWTQKIIWAQSYNVIQFLTSHSATKHGSMPRCLHKTMGHAMAFLAEFSREKDLASLSSCPGSSTLTSSPRRHHTPRFSTWALPQLETHTQNSSSRNRISVIDWRDTGALWITPAVHFLCPGVLSSRTPAPPQPLYRLHFCSFTDWSPPHQLILLLPLNILIMMLPHFLSKACDLEILHLKSYSGQFSQTTKEGLGIL